ncbi:nucleotidyltransferase family protein [Rhodobacteraceae bacterium RKSG542]|uniref:nucleotidyltransferase family protein n=1 Tax=Pseudovibrio flavus TaxID=2529854 RepID=UPI0012BCB347|nr:nucleotidyltransferase family protein [Pseudovibrio flavus]MTI17803.1 nucleotidyltransferase family protein [Pseudovibrio flavus]
MLSDSHFRPDHAIVLSAGMGTRMRPITATTPKPLVEVCGTAMLDHALLRLEKGGIKKCVVNVHYLADLVEFHAAKFKGMEMAISDERGMLLETGGGVKKALPMLGDSPFVVTNSDSLWVEGVMPNLEHLANAWDPEKMDMLLLLALQVNSVGYDGKGDFEMDSEGVLARRQEKRIAPFVYSGTMIIKPELFADTPDGPFSLNLLFDRAIEQGRLYGIEGDGMWLHVGTPEGLKDAHTAIAESAA